jgi:hypothetical protein
VPHEAPHQIAREWDRTPGLRDVRTDKGWCHVGRFLGVSLKVHAWHGIDKDRDVGHGWQAT